LLSQHKKFITKIEIIPSLTTFVIFFDYFLQIKTAFDGLNLIFLIISDIFLVLINVCVDIVLVNAALHRHLVVFV